MSKNLELTPDTAPAPADFEALADNLPHLAWIAEPNGSVIWYNRRWYDYTHTCQLDMTGSGWQFIHHPEHLPAFL